MVRLSRDIAESFKSFLLMGKKEARQMEDEVRTVKEIAKYLRLSESFVRRQVKKGRIPYTRIDGSIRFYIPKIREWLASNTITASPQSVKETTDAIWDPRPKKRGE